MLETMPSMRRPTIRSVALPAEHGGWGLTLEPGLLGLLLAPSLAGLLLGVAALLAFLLRTPLRLLLRRRRNDELPPTSVGRERLRLARRVVVAEAAALAGAVVAAAVLAADPRWLLPLAVATPLFVLAFVFDLRSLSRHLVPEVAGSMAIASVAAAGALAGGASWELAIGAWLILSARVASSVPHVRAQIARLHGRGYAAIPGFVGDASAIAVAALAILLEPALLLGAVAIVGLVVVQRITLLRPPRPARVLGLRQMVLGFGVVGAAAIGAWLL